MTIGTPKIGMLLICFQWAFVRLKHIGPQWRRHGGNGGPDPPLLFRPLLGLAQIRWKVFLHIGGTPCMYIVTFTAHQQRNMVRTPHFFGAGDATVGPNKTSPCSGIYILQCYFQLSPGGSPRQNPKFPQKNTQNTKNIKKCIKFTPQICVSPRTWSLGLTWGIL